LFDLPTVAPHPARYSAELLGPVAHACGHPARLLDPFAGVGSIHEIGYRCSAASTIGVELEREWANASPGPVIVGTALVLPFADATFDCICTSPTYGNRMADRDLRPTVAGTYAKSLGRHASPGSSCHLQWGAEYRAFHERAWVEALRVLAPQGRFVLNCKNHQRNNQYVDVVGWHVDTLCCLGLHLLDHLEVAVPSLRVGANADAREATEHVVVLTRD
jgi:tRNA G10  N-methylase Trm11